MSLLLSYIYIYTNAKQLTSIVSLQSSFAGVKDDQKKRPKWLRNTCTTKKCVFNNFCKRIPNYYNNGFDNRIKIRGPGQVKRQIFLGVLLVVLFEGTFQVVDSAGLPEVKYIL